MGKSCKIALKQLGKLLAESVDSPDSPDSREYVPSARKLKNCPPGTFLSEKIQTKNPTSRFLSEILTCCVKYPEIVRATFLR